MKRNSILGVLICILLLATACTALPAGGENGSIALVPFSSEEYGETESGSALSRAHHESEPQHVHGKSRRLTSEA